MLNKAHETLEAGGEVAGRKLVAKRATRRYKDPAAIEKLLHSKRVPRRKSHTMKLKSPKQLEEAIPKIFQNEIADQVEKHSSGNTMALESDKRAAITTDMNQLANVLPDPE